MHNIRRLGGRKRGDSDRVNYPQYPMGTFQQQVPGLQPSPYHATNANRIPVLQPMPPMPMERQGQPQQLAGQNYQPDHNQQPRGAPGIVYRFPQQGYVPRQMEGNGMMHGDGAPATPTPVQPRFPGNQEAPAGPRQPEERQPVSQRTLESQAADLRRLLQRTQQRTPIRDSMTVEELSSMFTRQFKYTLAPRRLRGFITHHMRDIGELQAGKDNIELFFWKNGGEIPKPVCVVAAMAQMRSLLEKEMGGWKENRSKLTDVLKRYAKVHGEEFPSAVAHLCFKARFSDVVEVGECEGEEEQWWVLGKRSTDAGDEEMDVDFSDVSMAMEGVEQDGGNETPVLDEHKASEGLEEEGEVRKAGLTVTVEKVNLRRLVVKRVMDVLYNRWKKLVGGAVQLGQSAPRLEAVFVACGETGVDGGGASTRQKKKPSVSERVSEELYKNMEGSEEAKSTGGDILDFSQSNDDLAFNDCDGEPTIKMDASGASESKVGKSGCEKLCLKDLLELCPDCSSKEALKAKLSALADLEVEIVEECVEVKLEHGLQLLQKLLSLRKVILKALASETVYTSQRKKESPLTSAELLANVRAALICDFDTPHSFGYESWMELLEAPFLSDIFKICGSGEVAVVFDPVKLFRAYLEGQMKPLARKLQETKPPRARGGCTPRELELGYWLCEEDALADFENLFGFPLDCGKMGLQRLDEGDVFEDIVWFRREKEVLYMHPSPTCLLGALVEEALNGQANVAGEVESSAEIVEPLSTLPGEFMKKYGYELNPTFVGYDSLLLMLRNLAHVCQVEELDSGKGSFKIKKAEKGAKPPLLKKHMEEVEARRSVPGLHLPGGSHTLGSSSGGKRRSLLNWVKRHKDFIPADEIKGKKLVPREVDGKETWYGRLLRGEVVEGPVLEGMIDLTDPPQENPSEPHSSKAGRQTAIRGRWSGPSSRKGGT